MPLKLYFAVVKVCCAFFGNMSSFQFPRLDTPMADSTIPYKVVEIPCQWDKGPSILEYQMQASKTNPFRCCSPFIFVSAPTLGDSRSLLGEDVSLERKFQGSPPALGINDPPVGNAGMLVVSIRKSSSVARDFSCCPKDAIVF
ncbi:hypothetical protein F3Y22_tig00110174pilonHSYRG00508 [Hibiscus syriacus]|uniref:Uncharacterized protein n=1 Tax=Hibiscus syriacus TaxID=106335 RepID=A0A6A3BKU5_HIBSY|nr:hypothetical protein F3Y22_tig00110174pilonHSYRG00508 [Hibiscus syriacus]